MGKLAELLSHPGEILPLVNMYKRAKAVTKLPQDPDLAFCYGMLNEVSRSFAIVIQELPNPLRDAICVFYLVLRGLDTVEDDMALEQNYKVKELKAFHKNIYKRGFMMDNCGYNHYKRLMLEFSRVVNVFLTLDKGFQDVIADITKRMGYGMAEFIDKEEVASVSEYNLYCHYVAGLVGIGLCKLFAYSELESEEFATMDDLANHMGLFLQKTNIIRDYLEDIMEEPAPRMFWPRDIWGRYASSLDAFKEPRQRKAAVRCLNHMVLDALSHLPHCITYMQRLRHPMVFRFCAIPQIMAIGTLALCYNNGKVFEGVVKMRRGQTALVFETCGDMREVYTWFSSFLAIIAAKAGVGSTGGCEVAGDDPTLDELRGVVCEQQALCAKELQEWISANPGPSAPITSWLRDYTALTLAALYAYYAWGLGDGQQALLPNMEPALVAIRQQPQVHQALATVVLLMALLVVLYSRR